MRHNLTIVLTLSVVLAACGGRQAPTQASVQTGSVQPATAQPAAPPAPAPQPTGQPSAAVEPAAAPGAAEASQAYTYVPVASRPATSASTSVSANLAVSTSPAPQPALPQPAQRLISIPAGTTFQVRLDETLDTRRNRLGDGFSATLVRRVSEHGVTVIPAGTRCYGHLTESKPSGRFKGRAVIGLRLDSFDLNGRRYAIATNTDARASGSHKKRNWVLMGGGSGTGAAIGAIAGGPVGALVGAGAGGGAGTIGAAITGKKNVRLPAETLLTFSLRSPVPIAE